MIKKRSLMIILLIPLLFVVLFQGIMNVTTMVISDVRNSISENAIDLDRSLVLSTRLSLQNNMVKDWSSIREDSDMLNLCVEAFLEDAGITIEEFIGDPSFQKQYLQLVFPEILETLRRDGTNGSFLILANHEPLDAAASYTGFFLRDSDPAYKSATNSDLFLERGDKALARQSGIALDSSWNPLFQFSGSGVRESDRFFYDPLNTAKLYPNEEIRNLGYWSVPFVLEDSDSDGHLMITYSIPLIFHGTVYGILGSEISVADIQKNYFSVRDLDQDLNAGYILAIDNGDGTYEDLFGKGSLYDTVCRDNRTFTLEATISEGLYCVKDRSVGSQSLYAVISPLNIHESNTRYERSNWVLIGLVSEDSIYGLGNRLYLNQLLTTLICAVLSILVTIALVSEITRPVYRLMDSIRGGIAGLKSFQPSRITEVDALHDVIQTLTETEINTASQLSEEKERYKIALESSSDIFFTYTHKDNTLEIVNSKEYNGTLMMDSPDGAAILDSIMPEDRYVVSAILNDQASEASRRLRMLLHGDSDYRWVEVKYHTLPESGSQPRRVIGFVRDIHEAMMLELSSEERHSLDPVTGLYKLSPGLSVVSSLRNEKPDGTLIAADIVDFKSINMENGLVFGDLILYEFAHVLRDVHEELCPDSVLIRAGSDEFLIWLPGKTERECIPFLSRVREVFSGLLSHSARDLDFHSVCIEAGTNVPLQQLVNRSAYELKSRSADQMWCDFSFGEIISSNEMTRQSFTSFILNLFDKCESIETALDMLSLRMSRDFGLKNLLVSSFLSDFQSSVLDYIWEPVNGLSENRTAIHHTS